MEKKKVLVVVAHPDDETIWMGGNLLLNKNNWDTTIISLCRKDDTDRSPKFAKVCGIYNAQSLMSDLDDSEQGYFKEITSEEIIKRIKGFIDGEFYDSIFTHGENGEYGHVRHIEVHKAIKEMLKKNILTCKNLFFFSYIRKGKYCYVNPNANKFIKLNNLAFKRKKEIIQDVYGFQKNNFEEKCCRKTEAFEVKNLK